MRPLLLHTTLRQVGRSYFSWATVPAAVAFIVLAAVAIFADHQNRVLSDQALRSEVTSQLNLIRAKLEGNINANLQLVRGLVAVIATEPSMNQLRFSQLAERLFQDRGQLRNITAAPGFVISLLYPMEGNEKALGLDYRQDPQQREAALRARDSHELVLAGPVNLRQGGQGFVGRFPVFLDRDKPESFWGIVSAVIDMERLYRDSGLLDPNLTIEVALIGKDAMGRRGRQFYGDSRTVSDNPVQANVLLPTGSWQIVAIPKGGWGVTPSNAWLLRAMMLSACALVVVPILVAGRLMGERQKYYRDLPHKRAEAAAVVTTPRTRTRCL